MSTSPRSSRSSKCDALAEDEIKAQIKRVEEGREEDTAGPVGRNRGQGVTEVLRALLDVIGRRRRCGGNIENPTPGRRLRLSLGAVPADA